jgi:hypothetical protein
MFTSWGHSSSSAFRICIRIVTTAGLVRGVGGGGGGAGQHARPAARRHYKVKIIQRYVGGGGGADQQPQNP